MTWVATKDLDDEFFESIKSIANKLGADPLDMLSVMMSESGVRADAHNDNPKDRPPEQRYNASGLIQFMPFILPNVGWNHGHAFFRKLTATEQLPYVERYYWPYQGYLGSIGGLYVATFLPALVKQAGWKDFVLTAQGGPLGWAYAPNAAFDVNHDLKITVGELEEAVRRNCRGVRWTEIVQRLNGTTPGEADPVDDPPDLRTVRGIQEALQRLGHDPGPIDGIPGPKTTRAVASFQADRELRVDGIVGPLTREALRIALLTTA